MTEGAGRGPGLAVGNRRDYPLRISPSWYLSQEEEERENLGVKRRKKEEIATMARKANPKVDVMKIGV